MITLIWGFQLEVMFHLSAQKSMYLPMYKSIPWLYKLTPILDPKNKFFLFLEKNFLEKLIFYLRIFFQVHYGYTKNLPWTFFYLSFWPVYKSRVIFWTDFFSCKRLPYTRVNTESIKQAHRWESALVILKSKFHHLPFHLITFKKKKQLIMLWLETVKSFTPNTVLMLKRP